MKDTILERCYNLRPTDFQVVFRDVEEARKEIGDDGVELTIGHTKYRLADHAQYGMRARAVVEAVYRELHKPANFNNRLCHGQSGLFSQENKP